MLKLTIRAAVLTLCIAGAAASAMVPKNATTVSHQANGMAPMPTCDPGQGCGVIFR